jgi:hypothetical protein
MAPCGVVSLPTDIGVFGVDDLADSADSADATSW